MNIPRERDEISLNNPRELRDWRNYRGNFVSRGRPEEGNANFPRKKSRRGERREGRCDRFARRRGRERGGIGEGDDDTTVGGLAAIVEMLYERYARQHSLFLSPFPFFSLCRLLRGFSSSPFVRTSSLLIADDVTPRPCHVAYDQDGRSGSGETTTFSLIFCPVYSRPSLSLSLFFRSLYLVLSFPSFCLYLSICPCSGVSNIRRVPM